MNETTYFERPNLEVTDSLVNSELGVFQNGDIERVRTVYGLSVSSNNINGARIARFAILCFLIANSFMNSSMSFYEGLPSDWKFFISIEMLLIFVLVTISISAVRFSFGVKIEGSFGKATNVEFDCGTDYQCFVELVSALRRVTKANKHKSRVAGVA